MTDKHGKFRSENITLVKIDCPKHGLQHTYFRYDDEKSEPRGIGCMKCFASLPVIKEKTKSKKYPDLRDLYMEAIEGIKGPEIWKDGFRFGAKEVVELLASKIEKNQIQIIERELKIS